MQLPKINIVKKKPDVSGYGQGRSPSEQRKIDMRILNLKCYIGTLLIGSALGFIFMGMAKGGNETNDPSMPITHQRFLMTQDQWQYELQKLTKLGNDPKYLK